jgi:hypothetical protein
VQVILTVGHERERVARQLFRLLPVAEVQVHRGQRALSLRGRLDAVDLERGAERRLQVLDCLLGPAEQQVQAAEVVQDAGELAAVVQFLVVTAGPLGVAARQHPLAHPLGNERGVQEDVRHRAAVVQRLRELERPLDVLASGLEVALLAIAERPGVEDLGPESVARKA